MSKLPTKKLDVVEDTKQPLEGEGALFDPGADIEVLGASTNGNWQSLSTSVAIDSDEVASRLELSQSLREELGLLMNSETLVVLAGSGTSIGVFSPDRKSPAPTMKTLWDALTQLEVFTRVKDSLSHDVIKGMNFEHVLSEAQARLDLDPRSSDLQTFVTEAESIVLDRCSFVGKESDLENHNLFLRKVARRSTRLDRTAIFTTNYDLAFEESAQQSRFFPVDGFGFLGREFDGGTFDLDYVRRRPNEQPMLEPNVFHLLKLHGSVDWDATGGVVHRIPNRPTTPVLIYPSAAKYQLSYQQPFLEFMSRFQIALRKPDVGLIVVGFGFNDEHLVAPLEAAIRSNIGLRAVVVSPGIRLDGRSRTISWLEDLVMRGDRRITLLNATFADLVKLLPDVPPLEERDAHAERVGGRKDPERS